MGKRHAMNLTHKIPSVCVTAVMDVDSEKASQVAEACGGASIYDDAYHLIEDQEVDAVLIAAPDRFHADLTLACLKAGKPVLCEKPLATTVADARAVVEAEIASGKRLVQLGFMREYDPAHLRAREVGKSGRLGRLLYFQGTHINRLSGAQRTIEDVITNSVVHDLHSARWLMEDDIHQVYTHYIPAEPDAADTARFVSIQLAFRNGALGQIECNADAAYGYEVDVKLVGERGTVSTNGLSSAVVSSSNTRGQWVEDDWLQRFETAYLNEMHAWVHALLSEKSSGPSAWDGYVSMVASEACIASAKSGQPVVIEPVETPALYL